MRHLCKHEESTLYMHITVSVCLSEVIIFWVTLTPTAVLFSYSEYNVVKMKFYLLNFPVS